jgi:hypothetical protein
MKFSVSDLPGGQARWRMTGTNTPVLVSSLTQPGCCCVLHKDETNTNRGVKTNVFLMINFIGHETYSMDLLA